MTSSTTTRPLAPRRLRVLFVRHGETDHNVQGVIQGQLDTPLNSQGHRQAAATGDHLSNIRIHRIITSPLKRALDTAQAIWSKQPDGSEVQFEEEDRLKERAFGELQGKRHTPTATRKPSIEYNGIESSNDLSERLTGFWNDLVTVPVPSDFEEHTSIEQHQHQIGHEEEQVVVLVSHGAAIGALLRAVLIQERYIHLPTGLATPSLPNCSITEVLVPTVPDRRIPVDSPSRSRPALRTPGSLHYKDKWTIKTPLVRLSEEGTVGAKTLENSAELVLRGPDGQIVTQDLGFGKGIGYIVKFADATHLQILAPTEEAEGNEQGQQPVVNVDDLVGR